MIKLNLLVVSFFCVLLATFSCKTDNGSKPDDTTSVHADVDMYATSANRTMLFQHLPLEFNKKLNVSLATTVFVNPKVTFQEIDGFGAAITGSTCYNLLQMTNENRTKFLKEIFDPKTGNGFSYIRISLGCSDFSLNEYTYCDKKGIENFAIHEIDKRDLIPILKEILAINPQLKIMASPWTCPKWMKVNNLEELKPFDSWTSGQLNPLYYKDYASYFVKYIQAMNQEGITIDAITIQNEPLNRGNSVSLYMSWLEQRDFIKTALGPAFSEAGIKTKIVVFDHNFNYDNIADQKGYPLKIYTDADAAKYIDGAAYHAYGGDKSEMLTIHNAAPLKNLYFTEMSIGSWNYTFEGDLLWSMRELGIGTLNNFNKAVIVWNLLLDEKGAPNRPGGCNTCYGAVEISSKDYATLDRKSHYYFISHLSKVIVPGARRIESGGFSTKGFYYTAVLNPDSTYAMVFANDSKEPVKFIVDDGSHSFAYTLAGETIASCRWKK